MGISTVGKAISSVFRDLLKTNNNNSGIDGTPRVISDGQGTDTSLYLANNKLQIKPAINGTDTFEVLSSDGTVLFYVDTVNNKVVLSNGVVLQGDGSDVTNVSNLADKAVTINNLADDITALTGSAFNADDSMVSDGTTFIGKSPAEMKTMLGLPKESIVIYPTLYVDGSGIPSGFMAVKHNTTNDTPTIASNGGGKYTISFIDNAWGISSLSSTISIIPFMSNIYNSLPPNYTMETTLTGTNYIEIQFKNNGTNQELPNGTLMNLLIELQRYI